jgi:hypothetical protein
MGRRLVLPQKQTIVRPNQRENDKLVAIHKRQGGKRRRSGELDQKRAVSVKVLGKRALRNLESNPELLFPPDILAPTDNHINHRIPKRRGVRATLTTTFAELYSIKLVALKTQAKFTPRQLRKKGSLNTSRCLDFKERFLKDVMPDVVESSRDISLD